MIFLALADLFALTNTNIYVRSYSINSMKLKKSPSFGCSSTIKGYDDITINTYATMLSMPVIWFYGESNPTKICTSSPTMGGPITNTKMTSHSTRPYINLKFTFHPPT